MATTITQDMVGGRPMTKSLAKLYGGRLENSQIVDAKPGLVASLLAGIKAAKTNKADRETAMHVGYTTKAMERAHSDLDGDERSVYGHTVQDFFSKLFPGIGGERVHHEEIIVEDRQTTFAERLGLTTSAGRLKFAVAVALAFGATYYLTRGSVDPSVVEDLTKKVQSAEEKAAQLTGDVEKATAKTQNAVRQTKATFGVLYEVCDDSSLLTDGCKQTPPFISNIKAAVETLKGKEQS